MARPVYINIFTFAFPITAIVSIIHRISGVLIFLSIPVFLGVLQDGLYYPWVIATPNKIIIWGALSAVIAHLLAGIRHLFMDAGYAESKNAARVSSYIVLVATVLMSVLIGFRLC